MNTAITILVLVTAAGALLIVPWVFKPNNTTLWRLAGWGMILCFPSLAAALVLAIIRAAAS